MATIRLDMRLNEDIKEKAEKAAALIGSKSLTEYVVRLIDDNATKVIAQHESITLEDNFFDYFMRACEKDHPPNKALQDALTFTKEQGIK